MSGRWGLCMFCEHYFYTHIAPLGLLFAAIEVLIPASFHQKTALH